MTYRKKHLIGFIHLIVLILVISTLSLHTAVAQEVTTSEFQKVCENYKYEKTKNIWVPKPPKQKKTTKTKEPYNPKMPSFEMPKLDILAYVLIALILGAVLFLTFSGQSKGKSLKIEDENDDIKEIANVDTLSGYDAALQEGNYRLAIRMRFIKLLQYLQQHNHITWKKEKTNRDYNREIANFELKSRFRNLASVYERVWYGEKVIDKDAFDVADKQYLDFFKKTEIK